MLNADQQAAIPSRLAQLEGERLWAEGFSTIDEPGGSSQTPDDFGRCVEAWGVGARTAFFPNLP